jgi:hypothetical protein
MAELTAGLKSRPFKAKQGLFAEIAFSGGNFPGKVCVLFTSPHREALFQQAGYRYAGCGGAMPLC